MSEALSAEISASLLWLFQDTLGLTTIADASRLEYDAQLSDGAGAGQADLIWHDLRTVVAGGHDDLPLAALPQTIFGSAVTVDFATVKGVLIVNANTTSGDDLLVGAAATHAWSAPFGTATDRVHVPAGSCLLLVNKNDGWTVAVGTSDTLRVTNPGSDDIQYKVVLVGVRA
ncbi:MAG TPA: hypothetical protein VGN12_10400 [Pirellulales bacterium]